MTRRFKKFDIFLKRKVLIFFNMSVKGDIPGENLCEV